MRASRVPDHAGLGLRHADSLGERYPGQSWKTRSTLMLASLMQRVGNGVRLSPVPLGQEGPSCLSTIYIQPLSVPNSACSSLLSEMSYFKCFPSAPKGAMCLSCFRVKRENQFHFYLRKIWEWGWHHCIKMRVGMGSKVFGSPPPWPAMSKQ